MPESISNQHTGTDMLETSLYNPVKRFLEGLGFAVKGEVGGCDLLALSADAPPVVVVCELKLNFNLELLLQGVDRAAACDEVWLGVEEIGARQGAGERRTVSQSVPAPGLRTAHRDWRRRGRGHPQPGRPRPPAGTRDGGRA